jgi:hypothetical protein
MEKSDVTKEDNSLSQILEELQNTKISTGIEGLDKLFYDEGLQLRLNGKDKLSIVILGATGTSKSLFAMQLLHGITKSINKALKKEFKEKLGISQFIGKNDANRMKDMFLDYIISKSIKQIINETVQNSNEETQDNNENNNSNDRWKHNYFAFKFFNKSECEKFFPTNIFSIDEYISKGIIRYNCEKSALEMNLSDNERRFIAHRKQYENLNLKNLEDESFKEWGEALMYDFFPIDIINQEDRKLITTKGKIIPCIVIDTTKKENESIKKDNALISITIIDDEKLIKMFEPDILIEMRSYEDLEINYYINQIRISKCTLQSAALGWHRYKKRDYGIEIYPSIHILLQKIDHMPNSLLRSNFDVLCDIKDIFPNNTNYDISTCEQNLHNKKLERLKNLYESYNSNINFSKIP